jgi:hypothetical protein
LNRGSLAALDAEAVSRGMFGVQKPQTAFHAKAKAEAGYRFYA